MVQRGIAEAGFTTCTPIQEASLPFSLSGRDIAGQAQTGTGKTAAYLVTIFTRLLRGRQLRRGAGSGPRTLVVAPTRELAIQIREEAEMLGRYCRLTIHAVYGGVDYVKQLERLKQGVDVLVGTPGRLLDYHRQRAFRLDQTEILVIDEADRMFDMGFIDDIRYLMHRLPPPGSRQSLLYSATLAMRVRELAYEYMDNAEWIAVGADKITADNIKQVVYHVGRAEKLPVLLGLFRREQPERALVFVNTRVAAARLAERLNAQGYRAGALAGDINQRKRLKLLEDFKNGRLAILVATDVASRGLHIEAVSHVFNYDLPQDPEDYVHRIGRTARAGASGKALSLACEKYVYSLEAIEEFIESKIPHEFPGDDLLARPPRYRHSAPRSGRRKGGGKEPTPETHKTLKPRSGPTQKGATQAHSSEASPGKRTRRRRRRRSSGRTKSSTE